MIRMFKEILYAKMKMRTQPCKSVYYLQKKKHVSQYINKRIKSLPPILKFYQINSSFISSSIVTPFD